MVWLPLVLLAIPFSLAFAFLLMQYVGLSANLMSLAGLAMSNQVNANQLRRWVQLHGTARESAAAAPRPVARPTARPRCSVRLSRMSLSSLNIA